MTAPALEYGTAAWQADRANYLGASDMPMACGVSEYGGPLDLVRRKLGLDVVEQTHTMLRGHLYEAAILAEYQALHPEVTLQKVGTVAHERGDWYRATLDAIETTRFGRGNVEAKLVTPYLIDQYGESGSADVPYDKQVQCQSQMDVCKLEYTKLVVNFGYETRVYFIERDREMADGIFDIGHNLWHNHIVPKVLPDPDPNADTMEAIVRTFRKQNERMLTADESQAALVAEFGAVKAAKKAAEEREEELKAIIATLIGSNYGIDTPSSGNVKWPESEGRSSIDVDGLIRELKVPEEVLQKFTRIGSPYRTMRYYPPKKGAKR